jgi:hypothetical protein
MNPIVSEVLQKNAADIQAIVEAIGIGTLIKLAPHFEAILATVQAASAPKPAA